MPVPVGHQQRLAGGRFDQVFQRVELALVEAEYLFVLPIHRAARQLQQLPRQRRGIGRVHLAAVQLQHQLPLQRVVQLLLLCTQTHLHAAADQFRHPQVVGGLHGHADVADAPVYLRLRAGARLVGKHLLGAALVGKEILLAEVGDEAPEALAHIEQIDLRPQVDERVRRGRPRKADDPPAQGAYLLQRPEPLRLAAFERGQFVDHQRVEVPAMILHQPRHVLPVDDVQHRLFVQRRPPLFFRTQHQRTGQPLEMVPLGDLGGPGILRHAFGRNDQHTCDIEAVQQQLPQRRQRDDALAQPKPISRIRPQ